MTKYVLRFWCLDRELWTRQSGAVVICVRMFGFLAKGAKVLIGG